MVDVFEKKIQGGNALGEAALDFAPFLVGNDARQQVVGKNALGAFVVAVDREGDALVQKERSAACWLLRSSSGGSSSSVWNSA